MQPAALTSQEQPAAPTHLRYAKHLHYVQRDKKMLQNLKPNKAADQDEIWPKVLKELALIIAPVLHVIFTRLVFKHTLLNDWKMAVITAVFKKGDKDSPTNYQLLSNLAHMYL